MLDLDLNEIVPKERVNLDEFNKNWINKIHKGDCLDIIKQFPDNSIDVLVTSPPYNLGNPNFSENPKRVVKTDSNPKDSRNNTLMIEGYSDFDDCLPHSVYVTQQRFLLKEAIRCLKPHGAIFYNVKWRIYNGILRNYEDVLKGFPVRQVIIWNKFSTLAYSPSFFLPKYEVIYVIVKGEGDESSFKLTPEGVKYGDVWEFSSEKDNKHPAPYPLLLPYNAISGLEYPDPKNVVIFDPYMGSGTTAIAAECCGYNWIGTDVSDQYINMAETRLAKNRIHSELNLRSEEGKEFRRFDNKNEVVKINKIKF